MFRHLLTHLRRKLGGLRRALREKWMRLCFVPPNYAFIQRLKPGDVIIDVGTGDDPDFSRYLIDHYQVEAYCVDPTRKHAEALRGLEARIPSLHYLPYALGPANAVVRFYESTVNMSGSVKTDHRNITGDPTVSYDVQMVTLDDLLNTVGAARIAILKIDIEGVEYEMIPRLDAASLQRVDQVLVEFHHDIVASRTWDDTRQAIRILRRSGLKAYVYNGRDCLFYRSHT